MLGVAVRTVPGTLVVVFVDAGGQIRALHSNEKRDTLTHHISGVSGIRYSQVLEVSQLGENSLGQRLQFAVVDLSARRSVARTREKRRRGDA